MKRNYNYDFIRMTAIVLVILIHSCGQLVESDWGGARLEYVLIASVIDMGVPLFLMLSGALLLGKEEPLGVFFKKRFSRILLPFLIWSLVFYVLLFPPHGIDCLWDYPYKLLTGGIHGVYWFVYTIIGLYLLTPLLRPAMRDRTIGLWTGGLLLGLFLLRTAFPEKFPLVEGIWMQDLRHLMTYVGGFLLVRHLDGKPWLRWAAPLWMLLWMGAQVTFALVHPIDFPFYIFSAFGLFAWVNTWHFRRERKVVTLLSETSYGIYLCHAAVISLFVRLTAGYIPIPLTPFTTAAFTLVVTAGMMWAASKCKLRKIVF